MKIKFLGATSTVTGSKYLLTSKGHRLLIDCGLFQGLKELRLRNWEEFPIKPADLEAVVLTHAHIDHSGYLPLLVRNGFRGKIFSTAATFELCKILLPDCGYLQEEEARYANREGFSKHHPAQPLYTQEDAQKTLRFFQPIEFDQEFSPAEGFSARFEPSGHILGAALVYIESDGARVLFSGDLGRPHDPLLDAPRSPKPVDFLLVESTYGNRTHDTANPEDLLGAVIRRCVDRGGSMVVPAFSVGRTQLLLHFLSRLRKRHEIPDVPIYLNSPMSVRATEVFLEFEGQHRLTHQECEELRAIAHCVRDVEESKLLNKKGPPKIIISANGMATGGRVVHHLKAFAPDPKNTILFTGYQAIGTRGAKLVQGAQYIRIHGQDIPVRAEVAVLHNLSAHADATESVAWLRGLNAPPRVCFVTHGDPEAAAALQARIKTELTWKDVRVPRYLEEIDLAQNPPAF